MGNVTIRILAGKLQLSTATVSKALTDSHEISEKTKQRVLALAAELNYTPNPYASGLRKKKSRTIAVILPEVADSFFAQAIDGIESIAQEKGYHVLIRLTHESFEKEKSILQDLRGGRADGVLMSVSAATEDSSPIRELQDKGIPLVFFDRVSEDISTAKVVTDDQESAYEATGHLIRNGCRRIVLLSASTTLSIINQRIEGYRKALSDHQMPLRDSDIVTCSPDPVVNDKILKSLLSGGDPPDGFIATVEKLVTPVYLACRDLQLRIPDQVKVIGFSNLPSAPLLSPSLTTITQPAFEMGKAAASLLFKALERDQFTLAEHNLVIPSILMVRGSTGG
ncbi:MAG TPA: LacI family DNA-binding transcriptional regulator, partial [Puia sp.]|nr:LacI family DNA-binding transcriptional regulator [Puia sp.]